MTRVTRGLRFEQWKYEALVRSLNFYFLKIEKQRDD